MRLQRFITFPGTSAIAQVAIQMSQVGPCLGNDTRVPRNRQYLSIIRNGQSEISTLMFDQGYTEVDVDFLGPVLRRTIEMQQSFVQLSLPLV